MEELRFLLSLRGSDSSPTCVSVGEDRLLGAFDESVSLLHLDGLIGQLSINTAALPTAWLCGVVHTLFCVFRLLHYPSLPVRARLHQDTSRSVSLGEVSVASYFAWTG